MRRLLLTVVAAMLFVPAVAALADPREGDVLAIVEALLLEEPAATKVTTLLKARHAQGETLRERAKTHTEALRAASQAGDNKAMATALEALETLKWDARASEDETAASLQALLTLEQRAELTLRHLDRRERIVQHLRGMVQR